MGFFSRLFGSRDQGPKPCKVVVTHVTADPPDFYSASCDCGWVGECYDTPEPAFDESRRHSLNVVDKVLET